MPLQISLRSVIRLAGLALVLAITGCHRNQQVADPAFTEKVSAYTSGTISSASVIRVVLAQDYPGMVTPNSPVSKRVFRFKPALKGQTVWIDSRTLEFRPDQPLESGRTYKVRFSLSRILSVPRNLSVMPFSFSVIRQAFSVRFDGYQSYHENDLGLNRLQGTVYTADVIDPEKMGTFFTAVQGRGKRSLHWETGEDSRSFRFTVDSVSRSDNREPVEIRWDAGIIQKGLDGKAEFEIPALGDFRIMEVSVIQQPEQVIRILFSDPLRKKQNFEGLVYLEQGTSLNFSVEGNVLKAYPVIRQNGNDNLNIREGILNSQGKILPQSHTEMLAFEMPKPEVRLTGKGVILPSATGLVFPFEAINLSAVDVKVIKIFENNIGHFLQVNQLNGNDQLKRAGRLIHRQTVDLSHEPVNLSQWNRFHLDLAKLISPDPGAIYRIEISFRRKYSLFFCEGAAQDETEPEFASQEDDWEEGETSYWDSYEDYYYDYEDGYGYDYNWEERDNPCTSSYYTSNRWIARNILASDLGIIVKAGESLFCAITGLTDSKPIRGAEVTLYNFQQQVIASGKTDKSGFVDLTPSGKPFLLIARYENQRGYLRLDDGSSLSLGAFDVSGEPVQKGIKGFIYGERGVWRPGDTLFTTFVLEDKQGMLPAGHPVIFELHNPQGQLYNRFVKTTGVNGFYCMAIPTGTEVPTGNWNLRVKAGGAVFEKTLKIETVKPNRLKIDLDLHVPRITSAQTDVSGSLTSRWLHGAVAGRLRSTVSVLLTGEPTSFPSYPAYQFTDPARDFTAEEQEIFDGYTDEEGRTEVPMHLDPPSGSPGMLKANFTVRVFERGGDFSIDRFSIPYSPYTLYVGLRTPEGDKRGMLLTDTTHWVDVVTLDEEGRPVSKEGLEATVYKLNWRNWWEPENGELANFMGNTYNDPVVTQTLHTRNGKGRFSFRIDRPEWGRFYVRVADPDGGHAAGRIVYIDWPGWAGRPMRENPEAASMLSFNSDKPKYRVGETAELIIPSGGTGNILLSLESGSGILMKKWIPAEQKETRVKIALTADMAPNVYAHVMLVQPHATSANDLPMRLYGVIPLFVEDPDTRLTPVISVPGELQPLQAFTVQVSEQSKRPMTYTLAIVEDGLLDLTRFKTPDPWSRFYAREALGVKTWDLYDMVIGAFGGKLGSLLGIGGDDEVNPAGSGRKANRFKPVVRFMGPFTLKSGEINRHKVVLPNYIGSVRVMVVAGQQGAYGTTEKTVPVKKPLMVLATLPRVMGPGESVKLPVTVFAMDKQVKDVRIDIQTNNLLTAGVKSGYLSFSETGDKIADFDLTAGGTTGVAKVKVTATSGSFRAEYDVELNIRNANPPVNSLVAGSADAGETWESAWEMPGMDPGRTAVLEISGIPPIDADRRLKYLLQYPHGCIEQTTSTVFAQLSLADVLDLDDKYKTAIDKHIKDGIRKIAAFQISDGGFSYWPGAQQTDSWGTSYAGHFLLEAEKKGYVLPAGLKSAWLRSQKRTARLWKPDAIADRYRQSDLEQAYRLYTLALAGQPETGAMNRMREQGTMSLQARWRLAAAYALAGQIPVAREMVNRAETDVTVYATSGSSYGSRERDWAMILETLTLLQDNTWSADLARRISETLSSPRWLSTQTTAYCLLSMARFSKGKTTSRLEFSYSMGQGAPKQAVSEKAVVRISLPRPSTNQGTIKVKNMGKGMLFARLVMTAIPDAGNEEDFSNNLSLDVSYRRGNETFDITRVVQGTDFEVWVTVRNTGLDDARQLALTQIFPPGWEISNARVADFESEEPSDFTWRDIRDDRVYTYFDLRRGEQKTFVVSVNASYLGRFYLPGTGCEAMYDDRTRAMRKGNWVEVVNP